MYGENPLTEYDSWGDSKENPNFLGELLTGRVALATYEVKSAKKEDEKWGISHTMTHVIVIEAKST